MGWFRTVDPQQLRLCPRVTEVAGIVFPANSLFQGLQIRVYNDLGGPARGLPPLPDTACVCWWVQAEKERRWREMTSQDETSSLLLNNTNQLSPPSFAANAASSQTHSEFSTSFPSIQLRQTLLAEKVKSVKGN